MYAPTPFVWTALAPFLLTLTAAPGSAGQGSPTPTPRTDFEDQVEVRLIEIDLTVRDRKGRLVEGLTAADFDVFEDGERLEIESFERQAPRERLFPSLSRAQQKRSKSSRPEEPRVSSPRAAPLIVIALDREALAGLQARAIRSSLQKLLTQPGAENARWMAMTWDGRVQVVAPPGTPSTEIAARLEQFAKPPARAVRGARVRQRGLQQVANRYELILTLPPAALALLADDDTSGSDGNELAIDPCDVDWRSLVEEARQYAIDARRISAARFEALEQLLSAIGAQGEPATVVFLSDGLMRRPGVDGFHYLEELCPQQADEVRRSLQVEDFTVETQRIASLANALRLTLLPIDGGGQRIGESSSVEFAFAGMVPSPQNQRIFLDSVQSSLTLLASETGGRAILDANQIEAPLATALDETQPQYLLTVQPRHDRSGKRHSLLVVPRDFGNLWRLDYRRSYFDRTNSQLLADQLRGFTLHGLRPPGDPGSLTDLTVELSPIDDATPCSIQIDVSGTLASGPVPATDATKVRIWAYGVSESHELRPRERFVDIGNQARRFAAIIEVDLSGARCRPAEWTVGVGVRDELSRAIDFRRTRLVVPAD